MSLLIHVSRLAIVLAICVYLDFQISGPHVSVILPAAVLVGAGLMAYGKQ